VNVGVAAVAMSATLPGRTYGLALVKEPLRADLGLSDLRFNALNFWAILVGSGLVLPTGWLIDRLGTRRVLAAVAAALGGCVVGMSRAATEGELFAALTLVRGLGQGALSVVAIALVGKWFRRRAGPAMGVFSLLLGLGFVGPILAVGGAVEQSGWRVAWEGVGLALLCGLAPFGLLVARSSPEAMGVAPDDPAPDDGAAPTATLWEAARTPAFWAYTAAAAGFTLAFSGLTLDNELLLKEHGLNDAGTNQLVLGVMMLAGLPANLAAGAAARRRPPGRVLGVGMLVLAVALAGFPAVRSVAAAAAYAAVLGAAGGVVTVGYFAAYGHAYGRTHLGGLQAAGQVATVLASAVGPLLLAAVRDAAGGDTTAFFVASAVGAVALGTAALAVRPPESSKFKIKGSKMRTETA
jgi:MFS family permease